MTHLGTAAAVEAARALEDNHRELQSSVVASSCFLHPLPFLYTFVGNSIDLDIAWEPTLDANVQIVVSTLLSVSEFCGCICSIAVDFAIGELTSVAVSGSTGCIASTASITARVAATLREKDSPCRCIPKFFVEVGCSVFI